ncbi:MAG: ComF family protein [Parasphingorhabdus sp.]|nr:ComF family protein [Parasphingorhabdus sp.]
MALVRSLIDFALPPRCPLCGDIVQNADSFCLACWRGLDFIGPPWCAGCGKPFAYERPADSLCGGCIADPPVHDGVRAAVRYDENSRKLAIALKYSGRLGNARLIAQQLRRFLTDVPVDAVIVPVPLHRWRLWSRGFNQSVLIGKELAQLGGLEFLPDLLRRVVRTPQLRGMRRKERIKTLRKAIALAPFAQSMLAGRTVILVDDVYTSGATAAACATALRRGGAAKILVFCWARVLDEEEII